MILALLSQPAVAVAPTDSVLTKIAQTTTIRIGYRVDEPPFSYQVEGKAVGYSIDICLRIVDGIKKYLGLNEIRIVFVPVTTATRLPFIRNRGIDLECAATTNNSERRKQVEFSYPHFVASTRFVALKRSGIRRIEDLAGRSVSVSSGTINLEQLNAVNMRMKLNISVVLKKINQEAFELVANGKVSAFVTDDILLAGLVASSANPSDFVLSDDHLSRPEPYGILLPPGELAFRQVVNKELYRIFTQGEIKAIYDKWFLSPIPPDGVNLRFPMPQNLKAVLAQPKDYLD
ncbi:MULTISPECIES: amino acid ABC transporter substrate-binding protein [unclassified Brenneria]|uniref:amino acid ABC transporter substrate-binding protein n=1 Tax=unclassified Brenneria TaxID=2634434 RepID=UPI00155593BA|nr:amino acid ABC transporter substrate-binding protein [Brenneria sp. hezel4-2-4]MEE3652606.1 amino acid ABC transporter substrate-binding protein [Brenneria sp. HEZEL_4_2_4]NPD02563.1 amino acid ABC transporter substrate-binding protein [Brenneria sp. hezel4-2-4]